MAASPTKDATSKPTRLASTLKAGLHPRNQHRGLYDFDLLINTSPALAAFVTLNAYQNRSIDFANAAAVKALNQALLQQYYAISDWDIPAGYLCPPIPGRADYLHYLADLLADPLQPDFAVGSANSSPQNPGIRVLDIGTGANLIYPLIGHREYGWQFVAADIDAIALKNAQRIVDSNGLDYAIKLRRQIRPEHIFQGIIKPEDRFELTLCNPPFHATLEDASAGTRRKLEGLKASQTRQENAIKQAPNQTIPSKLQTDKVQASSAMRRKPSLTLNFGGQSAELYCPGGELAFIRRMISESTGYSRQCLWFSTLVSQAAHLPAIYRELKSSHANQVKTIDMAQGQKKSRIVVWTFLTPTEHTRWR